MSMNNDERLENLFQSGVALLERGSSPARAVEVLKMSDHTAAQVEPLLEIVDTTLDLPRYRMPASAKAALLARLTEEKEEKDRVIAPFPFPSDEDRLRPLDTTGPTRQQKWNRFLRVQQAVVAAALLIAIGLVIFLASGNKGDNRTAATPTAIPSPVITATQQPSPTYKHNYMSPSPNAQMSPDPKWSPAPNNSNNMMPGPAITATPGVQTEMPTTGVTAPAATTSSVTTKAAQTTAASNSNSGTGSSQPTPTSRPVVVPTTAPANAGSNQSGSNQSGQSNPAPTATQTSAPPVPTSTPIPPAQPTTAPSNSGPGDNQGQGSQTTAPVAQTTQAPANTTGSNTQPATTPPVTTAAPTATPQPTTAAPTNTPQPPATQSSNPTATVDDHGGGSGGGGSGGGSGKSTKTPSPTPAPTATKKPNGHG